MSADLSVLVVDDEPLARAGVAALVAREPGFRVVGECADGKSAVAALTALAPDLVLLDVALGDCDGFDVLARAAPPRSTRVIFVTAYDEHAVRAFDVAALDYLVKPFDDERFRAALARARRGAASAAPLVAGPPAARVLLRPDEIDWVEAADYCVRVHARGGCHLLRAPLDAVAARLGGSEFVRIHRGALIRLDRIAEVASDRAGATHLRLHDGTTLRVSRTGRAALSRALVTPRAPDPLWREARDRA